MSKGGGDGGGVAGEKTAKPVTTVQDCVSTFVSVTLMDIFRIFFFFLILTFLCVSYLM